MEFNFLHKQQMIDRMDEFDRLNYDLSRSIPYGVYRKSQGGELDIFIVDCGIVMGELFMVLEHESIHYVIDLLEGEDASRSFDKQEGYRTGEDLFHYEEWLLEEFI